MQKLNISISCSRISSSSGESSSNSGSYMVDVIAEEAIN